jgi:hypothetical protein
MVFGLTYDFPAAIATVVGGDIVVEKVVAGRRAISYNGPETFRARIVRVPTLGSAWLVRSWHKSRTGMKASRTGAAAIPRLDFTSLQTASDVAGQSTSPIGTEYLSIALKLNKIHFRSWHRIGVGWA